MCGSASDCTQRPDGHCVSGSGHGECRCVYKRGCTTDSDCDPDHACVCSVNDAVSVGTCLPSGCRTDADCPGSRCYRSESGCGVDGLHCGTPEDECIAGSSICSFHSDERHFVERRGCIID
jgi:hypothetical protein